MPTYPKPVRKLRLEIAAAAAKLIAVEGVADYQSAKRKAAIQLGVAANRNLPTNREIEEALVDYQQLFQTSTQRAQLQALRYKAAKSMDMLRQYRPCLVGPVATGTATSNSEIVIHLFSDHVEQVGLLLDEHGIPGRSCEKQVRVNASQVEVFPAIRFIADQTSILLVIFAEKNRNISPLSSITNKPMLGLNLHQLEEAIRDVPVTDGPDPGK